jgi:tRNA pseudouridine55 synthase
VLVDKPAGPTSHDAVARVRRALGERSAGHTGTLDPFATGLLVILLGRATRLARFVSDQPKRYLATARLGFATTTDDLTGDPLAQPAHRPPRREEVEAALAAFEGESRQRPPAFSARHVGGERSYRLARRGIEAPLAESAVAVHAIALVEAEDDRIVFRTTVSAGTYIRAIARDLGERLGTGAHLTALRREAIGPLEVTDAVALDAVGPGTAVLDPLAAVAHLPRRHIDGAEAGRIAHGRDLVLGGEAGAVALVLDGRLVAIAEPRDGALHPVVVLPPV